MLRELFRRMKSAILFKISKDFDALGLPYELSTHSNT